MSTINPIAKFDKLTSIIRVTIFIHNHPKSGMSAIIKGADVDQRAAYAAKDFLEENKLLLTTKKGSMPYSPVLSLNEKGQKIGKYLVEIQKILETP
ncbi:MAG: hypothetical protein ACQCN3_02805 [Candidatus Bathyarchaeia archaeon]|jgi:hypothetical protein